MPSLHINSKRESYTK